MDVSSASECSDDSDDSGGSRELSGYSCRHCLTTGLYFVLLNLMITCCQLTPFKKYVFFGTSAHINNRG